MLKNRRGQNAVILNILGEKARLQHPKDAVECSIRLAADFSVVCDKCINKDICSLNKP